jgi:hypothetical protein
VFVNTVFSVRVSMASGSCHARAGRREEPELADRYWRPSSPNFIRDVVADRLRLLPGTAGMSMNSSCRTPTEKQPRFTHALGVRELEDQHVPAS